MDRRQVLIAGLASIVAESALAQQQNDVPNPDIAQVKGPEELWYLLTAVDALIFCMAVAVIKDPAVVLQARREFQPYSLQLGDAKAVDAFNEALNSTEGQARVAQNKAAIDDAAKEIAALLTDVVSAAVRDSILKAFSRTSTLLVARAAENQSWWCHIYAFRKVRC